MKWKPGFKLNKLNKLLEDYYLDNEVAAYASKVAPSENARLIQVVFAEDRYSGKSADAAVEFYRKLTTSRARGDF